MRIQFFKWIMVGLSATDFRQHHTLHHTILYTDRTHFFFFFFWLFFHLLFFHLFLHNLILFHFRKRFKLKYVFVDFAYSYLLHMYRYIYIEPGISQNPDMQVGLCWGLVLYFLKIFPRYPWKWFLLLLCQQVNRSIYNKWSYLLSLGPRWLLCNNHCLPTYNPRLSRSLGQWLLRNDHRGPRLNKYDQWL